MKNEETINTTTEDKDVDTVAGYYSDPEGEITFPDSSPESSGEVIQPEVTTEGPKTLFPAPFRSQIGNSTVDLSIPENEEQMKAEYSEWWNFGKKRGFLGVPYVSDEFKGERDKLKNAWYEKYHGVSFEDYNTAVNDKGLGGFYPGANNPIDNLKNTMQGLSVPGLSYADFVMDAAGTLIPGMNKVDDRWDEITQLDNPVHQNLRRILSIVLPSIHAGQAVHGALKGVPLVATKQPFMSFPFLQKKLVQIGADGMADGAVGLLSDTTEDHNAAKTVSDMIPGLFGPGGTVPIPEAWKTKESDSPAMRKRMNFYENLGLSTFGTILGAFIDSKSAIKKSTDFLEPLDEKAIAYKAKEILKEASVEQADDIIRLQELDTLVSSGNLNKQTENQIINEMLTIEDRLGIKTGVEGALKRKELGFNAEVDAAARRKVQDPEFDPDVFDPDVTPGLVDQSTNARSVPGAANVARNIADTTAIKSGNSVGDPAPIITDAMREKGLMVGNKSRDAVMGVAEETRDIGRFNAIVDGIRYGSKQMNAAAWDIYTSIIAAENLDDVRALFYDNRDIKNFLMGRFKVEVFNEEQARAAAFALRDLTDRFLGREVSEASARVMDTLGRESATLAEAIQQGAPYVDESRAMDLIIDKIQFLLDEYALNKYLSGWSLRNKNWFDQVPPKELDTVIEQLTEQFTNAENAIHARNIRFTETLKELKETKPHFLRPLVDAFAHTNGDVDTLAKLMKYAQGQISPMSMLKSPDPRQMSLFAKAVWSVVMNNVLSGLSAARAMVGNTYQLTLKPMTQLMGHAIWDTIDKNGYEGVKRTFYYNGSLWETNRRALGDAYTMMKKAHKDPESMIKAYRKDFQIQTAAEWEIADGMRAAWEVEGDWGHMVQHDIASTIRDLGKHPAMRYGMTGLVFPDAYTSTMLAQHLARVKAYDDVFSELGYFKRSNVLVAEAKHYRKMFDADGLIKDDVLRAIAGEVQLNLDDGMATWLNKGTNAYPIAKFLMMFPRTASNAIKNAASWTPLSLIPGFNKYSKTIYARSADDIAAALAEHGIDMATEPNARVIFENLRAEYTGRLAFSTLMVGTLWQYAMAGNIRGNGHYNASRRAKERDSFGYEPKTINIAGKWVSYKGLLGVEQVLSMLGDMAYYSSDLNENLLQNWTSKLSWTISASFLNETPLQGFEPLIAITNGDLSGWNRITANTLRSLLPLSGGAGVLANAIDSTQKSLNGEVTDYIANRLPFFKNSLPNQYDIWTDQPLNDIDNPLLRIANAISPIKVSGTAEPWRLWLQEWEYTGISRFNKDSTGSHEYTPRQKEYILKKVSQMELWKKVEKMRKSGRYDDDLKQMKIYRSQNAFNSDDKFKLKIRQLPFYKDMDYLLSQAHKEAEWMLLNDPGSVHIREGIRTQQEIDHQMKYGNIKEADKIKKKGLETQKLLQYGGAR